MRGAVCGHDGAVAAPSLPTDETRPDDGHPTEAGDVGGVVEVTGAGALDAETAATNAPGIDRPWYRRIDPKLAVASLVIALGLVLIVVALARSVTGDEVTNLPSAIEAITPAPDAEQVLQQTNIVVDLLDGYEGRLVIDDVALPTIRQNELAPADVTPGEQVTVPPGVVFEPGNATLTFTPGGDGPIETFEPGAHTVQVIYWKTVEGEARARSYTWTFITI